MVASGVPTIGNNSADTAPDRNLTTFNELVVKVITRDRTGYKSFPIKFLWSSAACMTMSGQVRSSERDGTI